LKKLLLPALFVSLLMFGFATTHAGFTVDRPLHATNLRCEYLTNPIGVGETSPRLSWMLESSHNGDHQQAYRILVASSAQRLAANTGDLWDTGKVQSDQSNFIVYSGSTLKSRDECFWKVEVFSALGGDGRWSDAATWSMGLLQPTDWSAKWIDSSQAMTQAAIHDPVKIIRAIYRSTARSADAPATTTATTGPSPTDVTAKLQSLIVDGAIDITVNNQTLGVDPAPNEHKRLVVEYEYQGKPGKITVAEDRSLTLPPSPGPVWAMRKVFTADTQLRKATLYVTALGVYEMRLNGQRVGDHILAPEWTDYRKRARYQAYDVTSLIKPGDNTLASLLARGWYAGHLGNGGYNEYGKIPALLAQLEITRADGTIQTVATDDSWTTAASATISSDFMLGESYDARKEIAGWDQPGTLANALDWLPVTLRKSPRISLDWQVAPPVHQTGEIKPITLTEPKPAHWTFDLGQNMVGVVRLKITEPAGTLITLHHAEMLNPDGSVYTTNLRGAPSIDTYTCKGGGEETWQPKFTFHGFRYVELTGVTEKPSMDAVTGIVLGSDTPRNGSFECSDPRINQLMSNIQWGQRGNYLSVPTDCPQRDERLGWMGDAQVFVRTATCNADVAAFFTKWLVDVDDAQTTDGSFTDVSPARGTGNGTPAWGDAGVICPWTIYCAYGDRRLLEQNLPAMTKWVEWCKAHSTNLLRDDKKSRGGDYGDWLSINADTPKDLIGTAYFAYSTHLLAKSYAAIGDKANADKYQDLFEQIKTAFNKKYVAPDGRITGNTQCCYAMALKFELLPDSLRPLAAKYLLEDVQAKDWHLSTGFVGVSYLLPTLTTAGDLDASYRLLFQDTFPSWLFSVKHGATTIWERWDGWTPDKGFQNPGMNSFNHYSLGSVGEWLYDTVAGITWDESQPGYKHILIHPQPGGNLTHAKGTITSIYGPITSDWKITDGTLTLNITIPPGTTATVQVPAKPGSKIETNAGPAKTKNVYDIGSGSYTFKTRT
jgi:alpha-L-rhamnosidase